MEFFNLNLETSYVQLLLHFKFDLNSAHTLAGSNQLL